jgi:hypothetical protein
MVPPQVAVKVKKTDIGAGNKAECRPHATMYPHRWDYNQTPFRRSVFQHVHHPKPTNAVGTGRAPSAFPFPLSPTFVPACPVVRLDRFHYLAPLDSPSLYTERGWGGEVNLPPTRREDALAKSAPTPVCTDTACRVLRRAVSCGTSCPPQSHRLAFVTLPHIAAASPLSAHDAARCAFSHPAPFIRTCTLSVSPAMNCLKCASKSVSATVWLTSGATSITPLSSHAIAGRNV